MAKIGKRKDGLYYKQIELPRDGSGKRRRAYVYARTKAELTAKVREAEKKVAVIGDMATNSPTLARWLERWLKEVVTPTVRPKTLANYRHMVGFITDSIGAVKLDALKPSHVRRLLTFIQDERQLSASTAANALRVLRKALNDAIAEGLAFRNVAKSVPAPTLKRQPAVYLTADQGQAFLEYVAHDPRAAIRWSLAFLMAMRQGECLGLRADHVDLEAGEIYIEWQLQRLDTAPGRNRAHVALGGDYYLTDVKSAAGLRRLPMPDALTEMMRRYIPTLDGPDALLCSLRPGVPRDIRADEREFKRILRALGLPTVKLHSARHTTLTLLAKLGVPDHVRQAIAGHASAEVTKQVYTHADRTDIRDAMARVGDAMAPRQIASTSATA